MIKYILSFLVQFIILFTSVNLFYGVNNLKFLVSLFIIGLIFIPRLKEFWLNKKIRDKNHYVFIVFCLLIFIILIVF